MVPGRNTTTGPPDRPCHTDSTIGTPAEVIVTSW